MGCEGCGLSTINFLPSSDQVRLQVANTYVMHDVVFGQSTHEKKKCSLLAACCLPSLALPLPSLDLAAIEVSPSDASPGDGIDIIRTTNQNSIYHSQPTGIPPSILVSGHLYVYLFIYLSVLPKVLLLLSPLLGVCVLSVVIAALAC